MNYYDGDLSINEAKSLCKLLDINVKKNPPGKSSELSNAFSSSDATNNLQNNNKYQNLLDEFLNLVDINSEPISKYNIEPTAHLKINLFKNEFKTDIMSSPFLRQYNYKAIDKFQRRVLDKNKKKANHKVERIAKVTNLFNKIYDFVQDKEYYDKTIEYSDKLKKKLIYIDKNLHYQENSSRTVDIASYEEALINIDLNNMKKNLPDELQTESLYLIIMKKND
ncbi:hypothetical protein LbFV_ORF29 [Leptopilina boulardi filamentous virus]|uniref:Uncharacterized protein n=1 Tax=Leptopilina boulardi filamentous virus TaxID=552509 RepID=A0A1S5YCZ7_9VIRU|nr:hypothetical protein LbFV_ORF29 [Leptopilina boulardi filamentous virus]AQQ79949.1 hypothetical protein LbFV_ORF29 [Leptopilina boulardi filamentous virus]